MLPTFTANNVLLKLHFKVIGLFLFLQNTFWGAQNVNLALGAHDPSYDTGLDLRTNTANLYFTIILPMSHIFGIPSSFSGDRIHLAEGVLHHACLNAISDVRKL